MNTTVYEAWLARHVQARTGEWKRRLAEGLGHAEKLFLEKVWWPVFGSFDWLYPEFEVQDYGDKPRFLDFAYVRGRVRIAIEIDGYGTHGRDADRHQFATDRRRQNMLVLDGWLVLRFAYDDVMDKPRLCQQVLQQLWGRVFGGAQDENERNLTPLERETIRWAYQQPEAIRFKDHRAHFRVSEDRSRAVLRSLCEKGCLRPQYAGRARNHYYVLNLPVGSPLLL